jgi:hypothetical protein
VIHLYHGTQRTHPIRPVSVRTRIVDGAGLEVRDQVMRIAESDFSNRGAGMAADMSGLPAGEYVLSVEATLDDERASRRIPFTVRGGR